MDAQSVRLRKLQLFVENNLLAKNPSLLPIEARIQLRISLASRWTRSAEILHSQRQRGSFCSSNRLLEYRQPNSQIDGGVQ